MYYHGYMRTVSKRELNHRMAAILDEVARGETITVTERGRARWVIAAHSAEHETTLDRLERDGLYVPAASAPLPWPAQPGGPAYTDEDVDVLLDDVRGER